jgi:hypothetical protein
MTTSGFEAMIASDAALGEMQTKSAHVVFWIETLIVSANRLLEVISNTRIKAPQLVVDGKHKMAGRKNEHPLGLDTRAK